MILVDRCSLFVDRGSLIDVQGGELSVGDLIGNLSQNYPRLSFPHVFSGNPEYFQRFFSCLCFKNLVLRRTLGRGKR